MTYGGVAAMVGVAGGARAVGNVMAGNRFPLVIPCHRVIRSDGTLGGFGGGLAMKRALLEREGVTFDKSNRVLSGCILNDRSLGHG
jgi:methylated-DNA-[protein]-cysteine S-methyltransferase